MSNEINGASCPECQSTTTIHDANYGFWLCQSCSTIWGLDADDPDYLDVELEVALCPTCHGDRMVQSDEGFVNCPTCGGAVFQTDVGQFPDFDRISQLLNEAPPMAFAITPARAFVLCAQLQVALRVPGNTGRSADVTREIIRGLQARLSGIAPEIAALLEQGWHPEFDLSRQEFNEQQGGDRE